MLKDELLSKFIFFVCLVFFLTKCNQQTLAPPDTFINKQENFKPFEELAIIKPDTYDDAIKKAFATMSSGEKIPNIDCSVKLDLDPADIKSLSNHIILKLKESIKNIKTPTKVAPMIGEDFTIIDTKGYTANNAAIVSFTLFHKTRYFGINCKVVATRGSDEVDNEPWFIHRIAFAQDDLEEHFASSQEVKGVDSGCRAVGSLVDELKLPSFDEISYPESLEPEIANLQKLVPKSSAKKIIMNVGTRLIGENVKMAGEFDIDNASNYVSEDGKITGQLLNQNNLGDAKKLDTNKPSSSLLKLLGN